MSVWEINLFFVQQLARLEMRGFIDVARLNFGWVFPYTFTDWHNPIRFRRRSSGSQTPSAGRGFGRNVTEDCR